METISYSNIQVNGFPFNRINSIIIRHVPNQHGEAEIVGEIASAIAQDTIQRIDQTTTLSITTTAKEQPPNLFYGCVKSVSMDQGNDYSQVRLHLYALSRLLDIERKDKTHQNTSKTYEEIIESTISAKGDLHMMVSNKAIGSMVMQYGETDWAFAKRLSAKLGAPMIGNISSIRPQIYVGMPPTRKILSVKSAAYSYGSDMKHYTPSGNALPQDFTSEEVQGYEYAYIGDQISFNGKTRYIKGILAALTDGDMQITYSLLTNSAAGGQLGMAAIVDQTVTNAQASGKMMRGIVQAVQEDKVQVHLTDIDKSYDGGGTWWFPYSTAYSSSDGSGWYCMPEVGDEVRVFFPSGNEGEAFAASSVCASPPANPRNKSWKAPGGKEILLTDEGMYIIGKEGKIYINLNDFEGISIHADKDINITSDAKVSICASQEVHIIAGNQIVIGTESAYLDINKNMATLAASEILVN